jgi:hypothetical protein
MTIQLESKIKCSVVMKEFIQIIEFNAILNKPNFWFLLQFLTFCDQMLKRLLFFFGKRFTIII